MSNVECQINKKTNSGILYVVATPIGNLEDITLRALRILKEVDYILCEDKRVTLKLLNKYGIKKRLINYHKFNENERLEYITRLLKEGKNIALVSDAGTPLIWDPGSKLISFLRKDNLNIVSVPGPSALTSVLSICPLDTSEFLFLGFLPPEKSKRNKIIASLKEKTKTIIIFIAPHDLKKYVIEIYDFYPDAEIFCGRELTKFYEEIWIGKIKDFLAIIEKKKIKGEMVLVINLRDKTNNNLISNDELLNKIKTYIKDGHSLKETSKVLAKELNLSSKKLYDLYIGRSNS